MRTRKLPKPPAHVMGHRAGSPASLPPRPPGFVGICRSFGSLPDSEHPAYPRKPVFVAAVEWEGDKPLGDRLEWFYLSGDRDRWRLWQWREALDDCVMVWELYADAARKGVDPKAAAIYLLMDAWRTEKENDYLLSPMDVIWEAGLLSVGELVAMADEVWAEGEDEPMESA